MRPKKTERTNSPTFVLLAAARHLFRGSLGRAEVNVGEDIGPGLLSLEIGVMQDFFFNLGFWDYLSSTYQTCTRDLGNIYRQYVESISQKPPLPGSCRPRGTCRFISYVSCIILLYCIISCICIILYIIHVCMQISGLGETENTRRQRVEVGITNLDETLVEGEVVPNRVLGGREVEIKA